MSKVLSTLVAANFVTMTLTPAAFAQDQKKEQVHKGTAEQGTVQKKAQQKAQQKDGTGGQTKKGDARKRLRASALKKKAGFNPAFSVCGRLGRNAGQRVSSRSGRRSRGTSGA